MKSYRLALSAHGPSPADMVECNRVYLLFVLKSGDKRSCFWSEAHLDSCS